MLQNSGPGKSANAPAHRALAAVAENESLAKLPFGKVVSAISRGTLETLIAEMAPSVPNDAVEGTASTEAGILPDGDPAPVIDDAPPAESAPAVPGATTMVSEGPMDGKIAEPFEPQI